jgi:tetratricopeptide (TPR) repeat protein
MRPPPGRDEFVHRNAVSSLLITSVALILAGTAAADTVRGTGHLSARELGRKAIKCLERGEGSNDPKQKRLAYEEGLELARRAVALDDSNADGHFAIFANEGRLMLLDGAAVNPINLYKVSSELDRALELDPNHSDALAAKGGLYRQLPWFLGGNLDKAEDLLVKSIENNPDAVNARIELAATYRDMGQPERGLPVLEKACVIADRDGKQRELDLARALLREIRAKP